MRALFAALVHTQVQAQDGRQERDVYIEELKILAAPCASVHGDGMDVDWTPVVGATKYEVSVTLAKNAAPDLVIEDAVQPVFLSRELRQFSDSYTDVSFRAWRPMEDVTGGGRWTAWSPPFEWRGTKLDLTPS